MEWVLLITFMLSGQPVSQHGVMIEGFKSKQECKAFASTWVTASTLESGQELEATCVKVKPKQTA